MNFSIFIIYYYLFLEPYFRKVVDIGQIKQICMVVNDARMTRLNIFLGLRILYHTSFVEPFLASLCAVVNGEVVQSPGNNGNAATQTLILRALRNNGSISPEEKLLIHRSVNTDIKNLTGALERNYSLSNET